MEKVFDETSKEDNSNDEVTYANHYANLELFTGTRYVVGRDISKLIKQYVKGTVTLDYGCASGQSTVYLKSLGLDAEGVDISYHMIKKAKTADSSCEYTLIKSGEIPCVDQFYDFVFCSFVLVHIASKEELFKITKEISRVLKVGGTFMAIVNGKDMYNNDWLSRDTRFKENEKLSSGSTTKILVKESNLIIYNYYWSEDDYREIITQAGMNIVYAHYPLGQNSDGYEWVSEYDKVYGTIFIAQKQS